MSEHKGRQRGRSFDNEADATRDPDDSVEPRAGKRTLTAKLTGRGGSDRAVAELEPLEALEAHAAVGLEGTADETAAAGLTSEATLARSAPAIPDEQAPVGANALAEPQTAQAETEADAATIESAHVELASSVAPDASQDAASQTSVEASAKPQEAPTMDVEGPLTQEEAEAMAWAEEVSAAFATGMADIHVCSAGCVHGQFDQMMTAYATEEQMMIAPGAIEEAVQRWKSKNPSHDPAKGDPGGPGTVKGGPGGPGTVKGAPGEQHWLDGSKGSEGSEGSDTTEGGDSMSSAFAAALSAASEVGHAGTVTDAKPSTFPRLMGLATWNYGAFTYPDLKLKSKQADDKKSWETKVDATTSADAATSAIATPAGTYPWAGTVKISVDDKKIKMKKQIIVGAAAAAQIREAEQEHLDDVTHAYTITLKAAEDAVNAQVSGSFTDAKKATSIKNAKAAVKAALDPKLTESPARWRAMLRTCANLTKSGRDAQGWHTFNMFADSADIDVDAKLVSYRVQPNPNVGTTSSDTLIKL